MDFYWPRSQRTVSSAYKELIREVLGNGQRYTTVQGVDALTVLGPKALRFNLRNGIPLVTERDLAFKMKGRPCLWQQAIGEIIAFINGAQNVQELMDFGCYFWSKGNLVGAEKCARFGLSAGDLGPGSYGYAFTKFPSPDGTTVNQIAVVVEQIRSFPETRTHVVNPWIPAATLWKTRTCVVTPCHGFMYFRVQGTKLSLVMTQRAEDLAIGVPFNTFQYAVLLVLVAQVTNLEPHEFVHAMVDAHIYIDQLPAIETMLARTDRHFPIVKVNPAKTDLFAFRVEDFVLEEYDPHPAIRNIPVADV
jgi:thymidylate synthase